MKIPVVTEEDIAESARIAAQKAQRIIEIEAAQRAQKMVEKQERESLERGIACFAIDRRYPMTVLENMIVGVYKMGLRDGSNYEMSTEELQHRGSGFEDSRHFKLARGVIERVKTRLADNVVEYMLGGDMRMIKTGSSVQVELYPFNYEQGEWRSDYDMKLAIKKIIRRGVEATSGDARDILNEIEKASK